MTTIEHPISGAPSMQTGMQTGVPHSGWVAAGMALGVVAACMVSGYVVSKGFVHLMAAFGVLGEGALRDSAILTGECLGVLAQMAVFFRLIRWIAGREVLVWLVQPTRRLGVTAFAAVIVGMFAIKIFAVLGADALQPAAGRSVVESLKPAADAMKSSIWLLMLLNGLLAAVAEEYIFRGYLSRVLETTGLGFWGGALVAAVIWAGLHIYYPLGGQAALVVMGVGLSYARRRTGSIYPGMVWHLINNALALLVLRAIA